MTPLPNFETERTRLWVPHYELRVDELPAPTASWSEMAVFAEFFPDQVVFPEKELLESFAIAARKEFERDGRLPEGLTMLRAALAAERHFPHYDGPRGDPERIRYSHALVADIQRLVEAGEHVARPPGQPVVSETR
jgi:hypothetical protein